VYVIVVWMHISAIRMKFSHNVTVGFNLMVYLDWEDVTSSGIVFQVFGLATGKAPFILIFSCFLHICIMLFFCQLCPSSSCPFPNILPSNVWRKVIDTVIVTNIINF